MAIADSSILLRLLDAPQSAPRRDELLPATLIPPVRNAATLTPWQQASAAASVFWERVAADTRISTGFRELAATSLAKLAHLP